MALIRAVWSDIRKGSGGAVFMGIYFVLMLITLIWAVQGQVRAIIAHRGW